MDFNSRILKKKHRQRITLEIDLFSDEETDCTQVEKIAESLTYFVRQVWCLADSSLDFAINSNVKVQSHQPKTHEQVQLPCANGNRRVNIS